MPLSTARYWDLIDVRRKGWDTRYRPHRRRGSRPIGTIRGVEVHYAGDSNGTISADPVDRLIAYKRFHVKKKRWSDIFYNVALASDGRIFEARDATVSSQRNTKRWLTVLALCGTEPLTEAQKLGFARQIERAWLACSPRRDPAALRCHRDRGSTACPGNDLAGVVADLKGGWSPTVVVDRVVPEEPKREVISMSRGSRGPHVATLQNLLNFWVPVAKLAVDGIYGPATVTAVKKWQTVLGVDADGWWGPKSFAAHAAFLAFVKT